MQREPAGDLELNIKKRARRRLVGAIALVLLMVIVLPMILKDRSAVTPAENAT
jgi:DedD protein